MPDGPGARRPPLGQPAELVELIEQLRFRPTDHVADEVPRNRALMEMLNGERMLAGKPVSHPALWRYHHPEAHGDR